MPGVIIQPEIFISYAWEGESEAVAERIEKAFLAEGLGVIRDKKHTGYGDSIKKFMQRIGAGKYVVLVISDAYLKKKNCMYELITVYANGAFKERIFPVVLKDARIYDDEERLEYVRFWEKKCKAINRKIRRLESLAYAEGIVSSIELYTEIRKNIVKVSDMLKDINTLSLDLLTGSNFGPIIQRVEKKIEADQEMVRTKVHKDKTAMLHKALKRLNYYDQRNFFDFHVNYSGENVRSKGGAFIIHGNEEYGQLWLYNLLLGLIKMKGTRPIPLDLNSAPSDFKYTLKSLKRGIGLGSYFNAADLDSEVKTIIAKISQRLKKQPVVITMMRPFLFLKFNLEEFVSRFWAPLIEAIAGKNLPHQVFLFLIEEERVVERINDICLTQEAYDELEEHHARCRRILQFSPISAVNDDVFKRWIDENSEDAAGNPLIKQKFQDCRLSEVKRRQFLGESGQEVPMLLIRKICKAFDVELEQYGSEWMQY